MALTLNQAAATITKLHKAAETALARDGRFRGTIALILPDASVSAVLPFGPNGAPRAISSSPPTPPREARAG